MELGETALTGRTLLLPACDEPATQPDEQQGYDAWLCRTATPACDEPATQPDEQQDECEPEDPVTRSKRFIFPRSDLRPPSDSSPLACDGGMDGNTDDYRLSNAHIQAGECRTRSALLFLAPFALSLLLVFGMMAIPLYDNRSQTSANYCVFEFGMDQAWALLCATASVTFLNASAPVRSAWFIFLLAVLGTASPALFWAGHLWLTGGCHIDHHTAFEWHTPHMLVTYWAVMPMCEL